MNKLIEPTLTPIASVSNGDSTISFYTLEAFDFYLAATTDQIDPSGSLIGRNAIADSIQNINPTPTAFSEQLKQKSRELVGAQQIFESTLYNQNKPSPELPQVSKGMSHLHTRNFESDPPLETSEDCARPYNPADNPADNQVSFNSPVPNPTASNVASYHWALGRVRDYRLNDLKLHPQDTRFGDGDIARLICKLIEEGDTLEHSNLFTTMREKWGKQTIADPMDALTDQYLSNEHNELLSRCEHLQKEVIEARNQRDQAIAKSDEHKLRSNRFERALESTQAQVEYYRKRLEVVKGERDWAIGKQHAMRTQMDAYQKQLYNSDSFRIRD